MTPQRQHAIDEIDRVTRELRARIAQLDIERARVAMGGGLKRALRLTAQLDPTVGCTNNERVPSQCDTRFACEAAAA